VTGGYCSASLSRRALTPWRSSTSLTIASKPMGIPLFERDLKSGRISDVTSCNVVASPTTRTSSPSNWVMRITPTSPASSAWTCGRSPSRPCKEPSAAICTALRLGASALASVRARERRERKPATPASLIRGWRNLSQTPKAANFRRLGSFARSVFVSKKTKGQISRLWGKHHFRSVAMRNSRDTWT
jgi:hypothetical protein